MDVETAELTARIRRVEAFYADRARTDLEADRRAAGPADLDGTLAGRGYRAQSPMSLRSALVADVIDRTPTGARHIDLSDQPTDAWFETWRSIHGTGGDPGPDRDMLRRVERASAYACAVVGGDVIAVGRAVADTGWAGVFGMGTLPFARSNGSARMLLGALARWAADRGAIQMYLQVDPGNGKARRLYDHTGFTELCRYHYRTR